MSIAYRTEDLPEKQRFEYWREAVCDTYVRLGCETPTPEHFQGEIQLCRLSLLQLSTVSGSKQCVQRRYKDIAHTNEAHFLFSLQIRHQCQVHQAGRSSLLLPGDATLYSSTRPYELQLKDAFQQLVLLIPKAPLLTRVPNAESLTARQIPGSSETGQLLSQTLPQIAQVIESQNHTAQHLLQNTVLDLVATSLASLQETSFELSQPEQQLLLRAQAYIQNHLSDPELDRQRVAKSCGVSTRRLSEIFAKHRSSISAYIRAQRLERVASELRHPNCAQHSISEIAFRWGFNALPHFSRCFRAHFHQSPRDYRKSEAISH